MRFVNLVLTLCWFLMLARLYQKWTLSSASVAPRISQSMSYSKGALDLEVSSGDVFSPFKVRKPESKAIQVSYPNPEAGPPEVMSSLAGRCFYFVIPDRSIKLEWCPEDHVTQIHMPKFSSFDSGWFKGWKTEKRADGTLKYLYQEFLDGDNCGPDFKFPRTTVVYLQCKPDAQGTLYSTMSRGVDLIEFKENDLCKYTMTLGLKEWCTIEEPP